MERGFMFESVQVHCAQPLADLTLLFPLLMYSTYWDSSQWPLLNGPNPAVSTIDVQYLLGFKPVAIAEWT